MSRVEASKSSIGFDRLFGMGTSHSLAQKHCATRLVLCFEGVAMPSQYACMFDGAHVGVVTKGTILPGQITDSSGSVVREKYTLAGDLKQVGLERMPPLTKKATASLRLGPLCLRVTVA